MIYDPEKKEIISGKVINELDRFVIDFVNILEKYGLEYVIVSGYVAIVLGRSRSTEDVDMLIKPMPFEQFDEFFQFLLNNGYECANTSISSEAYEFLNDHAIRFFKLGKPIPNIEFKIIKRDLDMFSLANRMRLVTNEKTLFLSPLELHVAFKLFLAADGTDDELQADKDIEDARFVYQLFKKNINKEQLLYFIDKLGVKNKMRWIE